MKIKYLILGLLAFMPFCGMASESAASSADSYDSRTDTRSSSASSMDSSPVSSSSSSSSKDLAKDGSLSTSSSGASLPSMLARMPSVIQRHITPYAVDTTQAAMLAHFFRYKQVQEITKPTTPGSVVAQNIAMSENGLCMCSQWSDDTLRTYQLKNGQYVALGSVKPAFPIAKIDHVSDCKQCITTSLYKNADNDTKKMLTLYTSNEAELDKVDFPLHYTIDARWNAVTEESFLCINVDYSELTTEICERMGNRVRLLYYNKYTLQPDGSYKHLRFDPKKRLVALSYKPYIKYASEGIMSLFATGPSLSEKLPVYKTETVHKNQEHDPTMSADYTKLALIRNGAIIIYNAVGEADKLLPHLPFLCGLEEATRATRLGYDASKMRNVANLKNADYQEWSSIPAHLRALLINRTNIRVRNTEKPETKIAIP